MNKLILILVGLFLLYPHLSKAQGITELPLDKKESIVFWKGTKMRGMGKHEGVVEIKSGFFNLKEGELVGGEVIIDMESIQVTDIPEHEPIPRNRLNEHLKSDDFFGVEEYPEAKFRIDKVLDRTDHQMMVEGELTIRDVTDKIRVPLKVVMQNSESIMITSAFKFDRFNWNVGYTGSWLERTLVDKDIELRIELTQKIES
ncbi:MAG: YceI family protein [Balneola sp.]